MTSDADSTLSYIFVLEQITFCSLSFEKLSNFSVTSDSNPETNRGTKTRDGTFIIQH